MPAVAKAVLLACGLGLAAAGTAAHAKPGGTGAGIHFPYPAGSLERREEGVVGYRVEIDRRGDLQSCEVIQSSGFAGLDQATCAMLIRHARFKAPVNADGKKVRGSYNGKVVWKIS